MTSPTYTAAIVGGTGYVGAELTQLLLNHPNIALTHVGSSSRAGTPISDVYPHLFGRTELVYTDQTAAELAHEVDVLFLALPHGVTMAAVDTLFDHATGAPISAAKVIDLSGDHRLNDPDLYTAHYRKPHTSPQWMSRFVYGLTEWAGGRIREAQHVANPGCFATAINLALAPLAHAGLLPEHTTVFAATGSTGSGAKAKAGTHHPERATNFKLYKVLAHQHTPEILAFLKQLGGTTDLAFIPASAPMTHGIYATVHVRLDDPQAAIGAFHAAYASAPFVRLRDRAPELNWVIGSNFADIGLIPGDGQLVVACAIDNMFKGAAGQAVHNMNLMLDLDPAAGLHSFPSLP